MLSNVMRTKLFGDVATAGGAYVPRETDESGRTKRPSLYVADSLSPARIDQAVLMIDEVTSLDVLARRALVEHIENGDKLVVDFIAFHRDELDPDTARALLGDATTPSETIARLHLVGLGVRQDAFVLDFSFGKAHTDELLVVAFDAERNVIHVMHES